MEQQQQKENLLECMINLGMLKKMMLMIEPPSLQHDQLERDINMFKNRINQNYPFTDKFFPPNDESISKAKESKYNNVIWKRMKNVVQNLESSQIFSENNTINFEPSIIIEDKYFVSALNILINRLGVLLRLFESFQLNDSGIYACWINCQGNWKLIIIDDQIPCIDKKIATSYCKGGVWVLMLEKAMANAYGSYSQINKGFANFCLTDLTGAQSEIVENGEENDWWDTLQNWIQRNFVIFAENDQEKNTKNILKEGYSYAIMDLQELISSEQKQEKIIQLRSPILNKTFQGDWSNFSSKWTPEQRKKLKISDSQSKDGTFWMSIQELRQNFQIIGCCKLHDNYQYKWINLSHTNQNSSIVKFNVKENERIMIQNQRDYTYVPVRLMIAKVTNQYSTQFEFIQGVYDCNREVYIEEYMEQGDYILIIEIYFSDQNEDKSSVVSFYSSSLPENVNMVHSSEDDILDIEKNILKNMALVHPQISQKVRDYGRQNEPEIKCYNDMIFGLIYFYYVNKGTKKLREQVTMTQLENILIQPPFKDNKTFNIALSPNQDILVLYKYDPLGEKHAFKSQIRAALDSLEGIVENGHEDQRTSLRRSRQQNFNPLGMHNLNIHKKYTNIDLLKFMRENVKGVKRTWNDQEISVFTHHYQHNEGVIILFLNYSDFAYEEYLVFELQNLKIETDTKANHTEENIVRFILNAYDNIFIFLNRVIKKDPYGFKTRSYYKYYED